MIAEKYKDVIFDGATFPDAKVTNDWKGKTYNKWILNEYYPILLALNYPDGVKRLALVMTRQEGFTPQTRSYKTNNPANLGNTDLGANRGYATLKDGIKAQLDFLIKVANGELKAYAFGEKIIRPFYSPEIARNPQYGLPPYLPGYKFNYQGELEGFIKIYSTGARAGNSYLSNIIGYLRYKGYDVSEKTTLKEIVNLTEDDKTI